MKTLSEHAEGCMSRKAKTYRALNLARDAKCNKKGFSKFISGKEKRKSGPTAE